RRPGNDPIIGIVFDGFPRVILSATAVLVVADFAAAIRTAYFLLPHVFSTQIVMVHLFRTVRAINLFPLLCPCRTELRDMLSIVLFFHSLPHSSRGRGLFVTAIFRLVRGQSGLRGFINHFPSGSLVSSAGIGLFVDGRLHAGWAPGAIWR